MIFSSLPFLLIFLPVILAAYFLAPRRIKNIVLLFGSLLFYAWGEPIYIVLMLLSIALNYFCGLEIGIRRHDEVGAKKALIFAIISNIAILSFFKYYEFMIVTINGVFSLDIVIRNLPLPIGISFYTFQAMSYIMDIYRKKVKPQRNILTFALYIAMFPQLVAGPIVRYHEIEAQLTNRKTSWNKFGNGVLLFIVGLAKKVILADSAMLIHDQVMALNIGNASTLTVWVGVFAFAFRIYFDFSGYSDMAIGLAKMFGFELLSNFNYPYTATSIADFWKRWHISLTNWFRDYVYIPLGGNRVEVSKHISNLLIIWLLTGLWHGAAWNFIFWGLYYGAIAVAEKYLWGDFIKKRPKIIRHTYALFLVMIGWVFFFSPNMGFAVEYLRIMFGFGASAFIDRQGLFFILSNWLLFVLMILGSGTMGIGIIKRITETFTSPLKKKIVVLTLYLGMFLVALSFLVANGATPFIYFRF